MVDHDRSLKSFNTNYTGFSLGDYLIFIFPLFSSMMIGVYCAWQGLGDSTFEYLMGRKKMSVFPVAMSLAASSISASTLVGIPMDVYLTGSMYLWIIVAIGLSIPISVYIYLPIYHQLQLVSVNQYLEMRFNRFVRWLISLLYIFKVLLYLAISVYGPSLALKRVTGIEVHMLLSILFAVCIFYTAVGGFKAVIWTGTMHMFLIYGSILVLLIKATVDLKSLDTIFSRNLDSSRIELFNIDLNPTTRHTVWSLSIGGFFLFTSMYATDQVFIHRCLAMSTLHKARISHWISLLTLTGIISLCCLTGLVAYAYYFNCDPLQAKTINNTNEIFPLFVISTIGNYPGLPGFFVAGVFSGAFSNLSCHIQSVALIVLEDFVRPFFPTMSDTSATLVNKMTAIIFGFIVFGLVFLVSRCDISMDASLSFFGSIGGIILGVFSLGLFVPWTNSMGAGVATVASSALMMWLVISTEVAKSNGLLLNTQLKSFTENCQSLNSTTTSTINFFTEKADDFDFRRISYLWYALIGMSIVLVLGTFVSFLTGPQNPRQLNPRLLSNVVHCRRPRSNSLQLTDCEHTT